MPILSRKEDAGALCVSRCVRVFVNSGAVFGVGQGYHGKQNKDKQAETLLSRKEPLCHESNMTSVHFCCHKTQGNDPLLRGGGKFRQQKTGKLTGQWMENELKGVYGELENTQGRVWVVRRWKWKRQRGFG